MHSLDGRSAGRQACAEIILTSWPARRPFRREGNVRQRTNILSRPVRHQDPTDIGSSETPGRRHAHRYMYSIGYGPNACTEIENSGEAILHLITAHSQAKFSFRRTRGHRTGAHTDPNSTPLEGPCAQLRPWTSPRLPPGPAFQLTTLLTTADSILGLDVSISRRAGPLIA